MSTPAEAKIGLSGWHALVAALGFFVGIGTCVFRPMVGLCLGITAAIAAVVVFLVKAMPRWAAWLLAGVAIGFACYYLLALYWILNPTPGSGSGGN